jgi:SpoIIAA-like
VRSAGFRPRSRVKEEFITIMIEYKEIAEANMLEVMIDGRLTAEEYHPIAEKMLAFIEEHRKILVLKEIRSFSGIDFAVFKEKLIGAMLKHIKDVRGVAVVTDEQWIEQITNFLKPVYPYPVSCFKLEQIEEARKWLRSI